MRVNGHRRRRGLWVDIGARIAKARSVGRLTQDQLAKKVGLTKAAISSVESGVNGMSVEKLVEVGEVLGVDPGRFLPLLSLPCHPDERAAELVGFD